MKVKIFIGILLSVGICTTQVHAQAMDMYGQNGNYYYGQVQPNGHVDMFDSQGNYSYGQVQPNGHVDMFDNQGNYSYGEIHR
jgi:hypothetical protein